MVDSFLLLIKVMAEPFGLTILCWGSRESRFTFRVDIKYDSVCVNNLIKILNKKGMAYAL